MRRTICATTNPDDARFCHSCGTPLSTMEAERLQSLRAFIPAAVAERLQQAVGIGDRRIVTVLFCDVVGSTMVGERLDPEHKVVMDQLLGRMIAAISRYEGTVAQVMGDTMRLTACSSARQRSSRLITLACPGSSILA